MRKRLNGRKKKRDEAKHEAKVAHLATTTIGDAEARVEDDLANALDALASTEEDHRRSKAEIACLAVKQTSLLLELEATKDEVSSLHSLEQIFSYGYECCVFKHNICGD